MSKDHKSNQSNPNKRTPGHNNSYQKSLDNRSNQLNPNNKKHQQNKK